ncbi:hypothetical protein ACHAWF_002574 [Thalassiosira exigua]
MTTSAVVGLVRRLAATVPAPSDDRSARDALRHVASELSSPQVARDLVALTIAVFLALELLSRLVYHLPDRLFRARSVPVRGKHLDELSGKDRTFIGINKCMTGLFVYCYFGYLWSVRKTGDGDRGHGHDHGPSLAEHRRCCSGGSGIWATDELSLTNTILPVPLLFFVYDFFYTLLHWALHVKAIYAYVHKHHHHQKAPSRANIDAVNVHPLEFFLGEFNHVLALRLVVRGIPFVGFKGTDVSWLGAALFIALGGILAGLNHTRHDVVVRAPSPIRDGEGKRRSWTVFDSKHHDVHHRIPQSNYGQYTVAWDRIFGTFREYDGRDRVNPAYQLDPATGKTIGSSKRD